MKFGMEVESKGQSSLNLKPELIEAGLKFSRLWPFYTNFSLLIKQVFNLFFNLVNPTNIIIRGCFEVCYSGTVALSMRR